MPYIKKVDRTKYDPTIDELADILYSLDNNVLIGDLNYVLFRLAGLLCQDSDEKDVNFARIATVLSAMEESAKEFRRRALVPYEKDKIQENGDVEL